MRVALMANTGWYLYNFRKSLMAALRDAGHRPVAICPHDEYVERLILEGFDFIDFPLDASGVNPFREMVTVKRLRNTLVNGCFEAAFTFTPKANIYFGLVAKSIGIRHVPTVSGLGRVFIAENGLKSVVTRLYRRAFSASHLVIFENHDDQREFVEGGLVQAERSLRVPGAGINLIKFRLTPAHNLTGLPRCVFLFIARILRDKGVIEYIEAARLVKASRPEAIFQILGSLGAQNPTAVSKEQVQSWVSEGVIEYLGATDDVRPYIEASDCVVLPSYREGLPLVLLEAAAMGRPCITTDVPGCRDAVDGGVTGLFCEVRSARSLADTLLQFLTVPVAQRIEMGQRGRLKVESEFDEKIVLRTYVAVAAQMAAAEFDSRQSRAA